MSAYVVFDVEIRDAARYQQYLDRVTPLVQAAGGRYLVRGGAFRRYEGDWVPRRLVLLEFPSMQAFERFYNGPYAEVRAIREACSSARLIAVEGV